MKSCPECNVKRFYYPSGVCMGCNRKKATQKARETKLCVSIYTDRTLEQEVCTEAFRKREAQVMEGVRFV